MEDPFFTIGPVKWLVLGAAAATLIAMLFAHWGEDPDRAFWVTCGAFLVFGASAAIWYRARNR